jgi:hypothetical protein
VGKTLFDMVKAGKPNDAAMLEAAKPIFEHFSFSGPTWQRTAWDSAIADQSATHLEPADLRRYAEIYADAKDMDDTTKLVISGEWLTRASDTVIDFQFGQIDGRKVIALVARYLLAAEDIEKSEKDLETLMTTGHAPDVKLEPGAP